VNKLNSIIVTAVIGLMVIAAAGPTLIRLAHALVPVVVVAGIVACAVRAVWFYTRR
jgi:hypothetical protein